MAAAASQDKGLGRMKQILAWLMQQRDVEAFLDPVDWQAFGLFDYPTIITRPMDLGTIKTKLDAGEYAKTSEVIEDIDLVWTNCKTYNQDGSALYKVADKLQQKFHDKLNKTRAEAGEGGEELVITKSSKEPTLEEKRTFRINMFRITSDELGEVVRILEEKSPYAMDRVSNKDEIEINIDKIESETFFYLSEFIKKRLPEKKAKKKKAPPASGDEGPPKKK